MYRESAARALECRGELFLCRVDESVRREQTRQYAAFSPTHAAKSADQRRRILGRSQKEEKKHAEGQKATRPRRLVWHQPSVSDTLAKFKSKTSSQANTYARSKTLINALLIAIMLAHITLSAVFFFATQCFHNSLGAICCADFALLAHKHFFITPPAPLNRAAFVGALNLKGH